MQPVSNKQLVVVFLGVVVLGFVLVTIYGQFASERAPSGRQESVR